MKFRYLPALLLLCFTACKKETSQTNMISFDFEGVHHSMPVSQAYLIVMDVGNNPGKYLYVQTDSSVQPVVSFLIRENTTDHSLSTFATLTYPSMLTAHQCTDTLSTSACIGFSMAYYDNTNGALGTYLHTDNVSVFNVVNASGTPPFLTATFTCQLVDSANTISPKAVTNGLIWDAAYAKR